MSNDWNDPNDEYAGLGEALKHASPQTRADFLAEYQRQAAVFARLCSTEQITCEGTAIPLPISFLPREKKP